MPAPKKSLKKPTAPLRPRAMLPAHRPHITTIEQARAYAAKNPDAFNKQLDKISPDPYRLTKKLAGLMIQQYPERFGKFKPEDFTGMLDSISQVESKNQNIAQKSYDPKKKKLVDGPAKGYFQMENTTAPTAAKRYNNYQQILAPLTAIPLPKIELPTSGDVRPLSRDKQAALALSNMAAKAAKAQGNLNPKDSESSWLDWHWSGSSSQRPDRIKHWKETFNYGGEIMQSDTIRDPNTLQKFKSKDGLVPDYLVVNKYNKPTWSEVPEKKGVLDYVDDVLNAPQKAATYAVESGLHAVGARKAPPKYENPSDGLNIQNKWGKIATDLVLDPMNLLGVGLASKIGKASKAEKAAETINKAEKTGEKVFDYTKFKDFKDVYKDMPLHKIDIDFTKYSKYKDLDYTKHIVNDLKLTNEEKILKLNKTGAGTALVNDLINQNSNKVKKDNISWEYKPHYNKPVRPVPTNVNYASKIEKLKLKKELVEKKVLKSSYSLKSPSATTEQKDSIIPNTKTELKDIGKQEKYFIGDRWQSYDELIKSNPSLKNPNVFYSAFHKKAPNDSTGAQTSLKWTIIK